MNELPPRPSIRAPDGAEVFTVARLNREAKALLEGGFPPLWLEGELSNLARPASGHLYFSLKDAQAQVRCAMFRGAQRGLRCTPRDGLQVLLRARVTLYEGRGDFQLLVEYLEEAGEGALQRAFEQLKARLAAEGLFDRTHKKPLPRLPRRIGVITSPSGAVIHDILTTLARRFPAIPVLLHPVPVQGEGAAERIAAMIRHAGERRDCDALILARGGGSLEDLWAFNEEVVARAIFACPIPIVAGVGHETDVTIADFVADARAPTPTAAAEMLSPDRHEWLVRFHGLRARLGLLMRARLQQLAQRLDYLAARLTHPRERLARLRARLAELRARLAHRRQTLSMAQRLALDALTRRLLAANPMQRLAATRAQLPVLRTRLHHTIEQTLLRERNRLQQAAHGLHTLSPLATLGRGYAIVTEATSGRIVRATAEIGLGDTVIARLAQGQLFCEVKGRRDD